jgi:hypothetical protein
MQINELDTVVPSALQRRSAAPCLEHLRMVDAYLRNGGLVTSDEVATLLARHRPQAISVVAHWIVARKVLHFPWKSETMVPLFQFDACDMSLRPVVWDVLSELNGAFDGLELAQWFTTPNGWLGNMEPLAVLPVDPAAVRQAARGDRFLAKG